MGKTFSLKKLEDFVKDNTNKIAAVEKELDEIQIGFNSKFTEFKADHDATLARLTDAVSARLDVVGSDLRQEIDNFRKDERARLEARRDALQAKLIPQTQQEADELLAQAQKETDRIRALNPELDSREERHKATLISLKGQLEDLNASIKQLAKGLGFITNMGKIRKLDKQRQQLVGRVESTKEELAAVREEWQKAQERFQEEQNQLQQEWQEKSLEVARLREELEYLQDDQKREALALRRAVNHVIDNWKTVTTCPDKDIEREVNHMVEMNIQTDTYEEALGRVAGLIALLRGVTKGMESFQESIRGLIGEQKMHSAYLPKLKINISDSVMAFHNQWDALRQKVIDDKRICEQPQEFLDHIMPTFETELSEKAIDKMFNSMGQSLTTATRVWKG